MLAATRPARPARWRLATRSALPPPGTRALESPMSRRSILLLVLAVVAVAALAGDAQVGA
jgi:hypothetical protein